MWVVDSLTPMNPRFLDCLPRHFSLFRLAVTAAIFWSGLFGPCVLFHFYQYRPYEISFTSTGSGYSNPFDPAIVTFSVAFTGPNSEHLDVIGFWDGGSTWKVRFAPPSPGSWSYVTTCSNTADTGLHNGTDSRDGDPYSRNAAVSEWRTLAVKVVNKDTYSIDWKWKPADGYPDQFRRDREVILDYANSSDCGYSSWTELPDGKIVIVNYTTTGLEDFSSGGNVDSPFVRAYLVSEKDLTR